MEFPLLLSAPHEFLMLCFMAKRTKKNDGTEDDCLSPYSSCVSGCGMGLYLTHKHLEITQLLRTQSNAEYP